MIKVSEKDKPIIVTSGEQLDQIIREIDRNGLQADRNGNEIKDSVLPSEEPHQQQHSQQRQIKQVCINKYTTSTNANSISSIKTRSNKNK